MDDGATLRQHLESVHRQRGILPPQLEPVDCPDEVVYIFGYFLTMNKRRANYGMGPVPLSYLEVTTWASSHGLVLSPFEMQAIDALEQSFLNRKQQ